MFRQLGAVVWNAKVTFILKLLISLINYWYHYTCKYIQNKCHLDVPYCCKGYIVLSQDFFSGKLKDLISGKAEIFNWNDFRFSHSRCKLRQLRKNEEGDDDEKEKINPQNSTPAYSRPPANNRPHSPIEDPDIPYITPPFEQLTPEEQKQFQQVVWNYLYRCFLDVLVYLFHVRVSRRRAVDVVHHRMPYFVRRGSIDGIDKGGRFGPVLAVVSHTDPHPPCHTFYYINMVVMSTQCQLIDVVYHDYVILIIWVTCGMLEEEMVLIVVRTSQNMSQFLHGWLWIRVGDIPLLYRRCLVLIAELLLCWYFHIVRPVVHNAWKITVVEYIE